MKMHALRSLVLLTLVWCTFAVARAPQVDPADLTSNVRLEKTATIITKVIRGHHYRKVALDNALSIAVLDRYLDSLDPNRSFFLASDIASFAAYQTELDDQLANGKLDAAYDIFRTYRQRVDQRVDKALALLQQGFDFTKDEEYRFEREDQPWLETEAELDELWRQRVKNDFLSLRLADKADEEILDTLTKRYRGLQRRVGQLNAQDVFQTYINAYTLNLDPHTAYMSPSSSENFDISMRLSLEGIGAVLRLKNEFTEVQETIKGGPAEQSGQVGAGDRIVGVAQGLDGAMEDVVGWRLQDVVEKIRGPKGSVVRLEIIPKGDKSSGRHKMVTLVRKRIQLEEQAAKMEMMKDIEGLQGLKIGIITVPAFYRDFRGESKGDKNFRSTSRDVRELLRQLEQEQADGVVIDLRDNGGGSLSEATELTGLFIDHGPVVQVKDSYGKVEVEQDPDPNLVYRGPLAVLVNRNSASASEIFAGAIQDYRRGVVIGEPTFGKGTVQTLVDLNRFIPGSDEDLGRLRLTMAQFFRINGGSTQHRGVVPDILYPTAKEASEHGERSLDNALPWDSIQRASYAPRGVGAYARIRDSSQARVSRDPGFTMLSEQEQLLSEREDLTSISLNEARRRQEADALELRLKKYRNQFLLSQGITPRDDDDDDETSEAFKKENEVIGKIQLNEAARILADYIRVETDNRPRAAMR
jgi:carboxyl-terminal processing protease